VVSGSCELQLPRSALLPSIAAWVIDVGVYDCVDDPPKITRFAWIWL
jgi:hypothetical protein